MPCGGWGCLWHRATARSARFTMLEILIPDTNESFQALKIAGDFTDWKEQPMQKVHGEGVGWSFVIESPMVEKYCPEGLPQEAMIHFKFIDDNGNWFTSDNFDLVPDEHNNINNAVLLHFQDGKLREDVAEEEVELPESVAEEPDKTPEPTLQATTPLPEPEEPEEPEVPEPTVPVPERTQTPVQDDSLIAEAHTPKDAVSTTPPGEQTVYFSPAKFTGKREGTSAEGTEEEDEAETPVAEKIFSSKGKPTTAVTATHGEADIIDSKKPEEYKGILQRLLRFLSAFFGSWFNFLTGRGTQDH